MTALRQQAFEMLQSFPDEKLFILIQFMQSENLKSIESKEERLNRKRIAYADRFPILTMIRRWTNIWRKNLADVNFD